MEACQACGNGDPFRLLERNHKSEGQHEENSKQLGRVAFEERKPSFQRRQGDEEDKRRNARPQHARIVFGVHTAENDRFVNDVNWCFRLNGHTREGRDSTCRQDDSNRSQKPRHYRMRQQARNFSRPTHAPKEEHNWTRQKNDGQSSLVAQGHIAMAQVNNSPVKNRCERSCCAADDDIAAPVKEQHHHTDHCRHQSRHWRETRDRRNAKPKGNRHWEENKCSLKVVLPILHIEKPA